MTSEKTTIQDHEAEASEVNAQPGGNGSRETGGLAADSPDLAKPETVRRQEGTAAELQSKIDSLEESLLRARADFQNLQRRSAAERQDAIRYANADLMRSLLGVVDDLERTLAAAGPVGAGQGDARQTGAAATVQERKGRESQEDSQKASPADSQKISPTDLLIQGVRLAYENFVKALRDQGLEPIEAAGRPFDPAVHHALMRQPTTDQPPGTVVEQVAKGYRLGDRVLRPARVIVASEPQG